MKAKYPKVRLSKGVCQLVAPTNGGSRMPKITSTPQQNKQSQEDKLLEMAKTMAKEMAKEMSAEIIKSIPQQQVIIQPEGLHKSEDCDTIELESSFVDPTEAEDFSVNLDNIESTKGESIKEKLAKLKKLQGK